MSGAEQQGERATPHEEPVTFYSRHGQQLVQKEKERFIKKIEEAIAASPDDAKLKELLEEQKRELEQIKHAPVEVDITHFDTIADRERAVSDVREQIYQLSKQGRTPAVEAMISSAQRLMTTYQRIPIKPREE